MQFVSFESRGQSRVGILLDQQRLLDLEQLPAGHGRSRPTDMLDLIGRGDEFVDALRNSISERKYDPSAALPIEALTLLAPIPRPRRNVLCVGRNYKEHVAEGDRAQKRPLELPAFPQFFTKPPATVIGPGAAIPAHSAVTAQLDYEVELALIIGKSGRDIPASAAFDLIFGVSIVNDISARDLQRRHGQWFKGKALDGSCPFGPCIVHRSAWDFGKGARIELSVNGERRQSARTDQMIFDIPTIISQLSAGMTLEVGDIIATGTPSGVGYAMDPPRFLRSGDKVVAEIEGIGHLENSVA